MDNSVFALWFERGAHKTKVTQPASHVIMDALEHAMLHSRWEGFNQNLRN